MEGDKRTHREIGDIRGEPERHIQTERRQMEIFKGRDEKTATEVLREGGRDMAT
jgi:hypothetical protein